MKAVVCDRYGPPDVLRFEDLERPVPQADEILVRIRATTVNRTDCGMRGPHPWFGRLFYGFRRPRRRILGYEFAGEVEAVGRDVAEFAVGDRVFGVGPGAHAEYMTRRESGPVAHMPEGLTFEEAAAVNDGIKLAGTCLRPVTLDGRYIIVYGASGSIGTAGVQLAKHFGAHVTAVTDTKHLELARLLGAHEVIDYTHEDFTKSGKRYDVVFDAVGKHSFRRAKRALKPGGVYLPTDGVRNFIYQLWTRNHGDKKCLFALPKRWTKDDILFTKRLIESGEYRPVVDRAYPIEDAVEAHRYVESGQKTGNVVLTV